MQCHQLKAEIEWLHIAGQFSPNFPTLDIRLSCTFAAESRQLSTRAKISAIRAMTASEWSKNCILAILLTMKKESENERNFIVKTRKKWKNRQSNSLIKLRMNAVDWDHPWQVQTAPQTTSTKFQRFGKARASTAQATARTILRSICSIWGQDGRTSRRAAPERPRNEHEGAKTGRFDRLKFDHPISTLLPGNQ